MKDNRLCFVIMPFQPELHYFYLYMKQRIESTHKMVCKRADDSANYPNREIFMETILEDIQKATVVIADCTGDNPNVMYELGLAHAKNKTTILITQDDPAGVPADIRHRTFIQYALDDNVSFFAALDKRLQDVFFEDYQPAYKQAITLFNQFCQDMNLSISPPDLREFITRAGGKQLPEPADNYLFASETLPLMPSDEDIRQFKISSQLNEWLRLRYNK